MTAILDPALVVLLILAAVLLLLLLRRFRLSLFLATLAFVMLLAGGVLPLAQVLLYPLETRFPVWADHGQGEVTGILVLGGGLNSDLAALPGSGHSQASGRLIEAVLLAKRFPSARVLYSGGGGEASRARQLIAVLGVEPGRIITEERSRSTAENAAFSYELVKPRPGHRWLLVTSAFHMPRAMGAFRAAGFQVEAFPVDFRRGAWRMSASVIGGLDLLRVTLKEYLGLAGYRISGRISELWPRPRPEASSSSPREKRSGDWQ